MGQKSELMRGVTESIILKLLSEKAMYGYEIIKNVNERTNGQFQWKEGSLYPCLHRMEGAGLISSEWSLDSEKPRKYYSLTGKGLRIVGEQISEIRDFCHSVSVLLELV